jgi:hypothetical protein
MIDFDLAEEQQFSDDFLLGCRTDRPTRCELPPYA